MLLDERSNKQKLIQGQIVRISQKIDESIRDEKKHRFTMSSPPNFRITQVVTNFIIHSSFGLFPKGEHPRCKCDLVH
jgi:hypothetical protein